MRKFIGHNMQFLVDGNKVAGEFIGEGKGDEAGLLLVRGEDGSVWRIPKGKIGPFRYANAEEENSDYTPFLVLKCFNTTTKCPGVQFIKEGNGFKQSDFALFMDECPCKSDSCRFGSAGELRSVNGNLLREMLADTRFGDYPKEGKTNAGKKPSTKAKRS